MISTRPDRAAAVDLTNCDLEPIHIPSAIQPHGILLAANLSDERVAYCSENSPQFLGIPAREILNQKLDALLGPAVVANLKQALQLERNIPTTIQLVSLPGKDATQFSITAHRIDGMICVELETANEQHDWQSIPGQLERAMRLLREEDTVEKLSQTVADFVSHLTGYERVMVYRFDPDGHGHVIVENKEPHLEPYLGLRYPATDIPQQARRLYLVQRFRAIVDSAYTPVTLLQSAAVKDCPPLDMTFCVLRSVSPIHCKYLQNMGVRAFVEQKMPRLRQLCPEKPGAAAIIANIFGFTIDDFVPS